MQTFLPYPDFRLSAMCLDRRRLGKQRVEARQILKAIQQGGGWSKHPATRMWYPYPAALTHYGNVMIREWMARGYKNTMQLLPTPDRFTYPAWLGSTAFHQSHQSNLLSKDWEYYSQFGWEVQPGLPYIWPTETSDERST